MENDIDLILDPATQLVTVEDDSPTVSVLWDRAAQLAVINDSSGPTIASRAYGIVHTAIYDAWASYDPQAEPTIAASAGLQRPGDENTGANKLEAMSYAAYEVLSELFPGQQAVFDQVMADLGLDPAVEVTIPESPVAIGRAVAENLMTFRRADGSNQENGYTDTTGYTPVNASPLEIVDITKWTPENVPIDPEDGAPEQSFLNPNWSVIQPFGIDSPDAIRPVPPEPFFLADGATLDIDAGTITLADQSVVPVSRDLIGTVINPAFIDQAVRVIEASAALTDQQKLIAEFWEDAGGTSFPPGTFMTFGQYVSARDDNSLDQDAQMFLMMGNAVFDAGVATWESKVFYDYTRPVRAIRELGELGLVGTEGTDELTQEQGFVIEAWGGPGEGTRTILAENFLSYQTPGADPSPPFAEYTSGHSAFSSAGAEILRLFTSSDGFGASVTFEPGESRFEPGITPAVAETLAWDSFTDAAEEAGLSRIFGGIHFEDGDVNGRTLGRQAAREVWNEANGFILGLNGETAETPAAADAVVDTARGYQTLFGRLPDFLGVNFWIDQTQAGLSLESMFGAFLASGEFARLGADLASLSDAAFLDLLFGNLGLGADAADALDDGFLADLAGGASRAEVAVDLSQTEAAAAATQYLNELEEIEAGTFWFV